MRSFVLSLLTFSLLFLNTSYLKAETPYQAVVVSGKNAAALNKAEVDTTYYRYFSFHNIDPKERPAYLATLSYVLNALNIRHQLVIPYFKERLLDDCVLGVNLDDLGINPEDFDKFIEAGSGNVPLPEPYFYLLVKSIDHYKEVEVPYGYYVNKDGERCEKGTKGATFKKTRTEKEKKLVKGKTELIPSLGITTPDFGKAIVELSTLTDSKTPIVRADWFITYALWAPGYYTLLGVDPKGNLDQIDKIIGVDEALAARTRIQAVTDSKIVALHNRILDRFATAGTDTGGYYWQSFDTDAGIDDEDYTNNFIQSFLVKQKGRRLDREKLKFQATEVIWSNPNGLQGGALTNNKFELLNVAVSNIAVDKRTKFFDPNVYTFRNCVICHDKQGGLWKLDDRVRNLASGRIQLRVTETLVKRGTSKQEARSIAKDIQNAYGKNINLLIERDIAFYGAAVFNATGRTPKENAIILEDQCFKYLEGEITLDVVASDCGISKERLLLILSSAIGLDHTLNSLLQDPPLSISRIPYERSGHPQLTTLIAFYDLLSSVVPLLR